MKSIYKYLALLIVAVLTLSSCGSYSSSGTSRSINHYHHNTGRMGWGNSYYGTDVIIIDSGPDIDIDYGVPEAVTLPSGDWD